VNTLQDTFLKACYFKKVRSVFIEVAFLLKKREIFLLNFSEYVTGVIYTIMEKCGIVAF
jgi:hypothetical protein